MNKIDAYKEILNVLNKHKELLEGDYQIDISGKITSRIKIQEISEEFGVALSSDCNPGWARLSDYERIGVFGASHNRTIGCSDDGAQPDDERLYKISFPTGPYVFGQSYPERTFSEFFNELKSYGFKYSDSMNKSLYFTSDNAKHVHRDFKSIFAKYAKMVGDEVKEERIKALEKELLKLKVEEGK